MVKGRGQVDGTRNEALSEEIHSTDLDFFPANLNTAVDSRRLT
jgi:hypothetical protein